MLRAEETLAIPLWINGRAYLTVTSAFQEVRNPVSGKVLRRTPLCGAAETQHAVASAQVVHMSWAALPIAARAVLLDAVGEALADYAAHFARMIVEETGKSEAAAEAEVAASVALLRGVSTPPSRTREACSSEVVAVIGEAAEPLLGALLIAAPALLEGAVVILRPHPSTPSSLFALAELTGRCGFPGGVFNVLHGGEAVLDELRLTGIRLLFA